MNGTNTVKASVAALLALIVGASVYGYYDFSDLELREASNAIEKRFADKGYGGGKVFMFRDSWRSLQGYVEFDVRGVVIQKVCSAKKLTDGGFLWQCQ